MTTSRSEAPGRRWPRVVAVIVLALALLAGVSVYFAGRPTITPGAADAAPGAVEPTAQPVKGSPTVIADGCLGGTDPVKAIRVAHAKAPLTPEGAAAFVATFARWRGLIPREPGEFQGTGRLIWAPSLPAKYRQNPPAPPPGTTAWVSTKDARYRVADVSGPDVTIEAFFPQSGVTGGESFEATHGGLFTVTAIDGHWAYKGTADGDKVLEQLRAELQAEGLPYRGGC